MTKNNSEFIENNVESILQPLDSDDTIRQLIRLEKIELDPSFHYKNVNHWYIRRISKAMRHGKRVTPVVLTPHKDGFRVLRGNRRIVAAAEAGFEEIPAIIRQEHQLEQEELSRASAQPAKVPVEKRAKTPAPKSTEQKKEVLRQEAIKPNKQSRRVKPSIEKATKPKPQKITKQAVPKEEIIQPEPTPTFEVPLLPDLDKENQELQRTVSYLSNENERAQQELKKMRAEVKHFRALLNQTIPAENTQFISEIAPLPAIQEAADLLQNDLEQNQQDRQTIEAKLAVVTEKNHVMESENRELLLKIDKLEEKLIVVENKFEQSQAIEREHKEKIKSLILERDKYETEKARTEKRIIELTSDLTQLHQNKSHEADEKHQLAQKLQMFHERVGLLQEELNFVQDERAKKIAENRLQVEEKNSLESDFLVVNEEKIRLEERLESSYDDIEYYKKELNKYENKLKNAYYHSNRLLTEINKEKALHGELHRRISRLEASKNSLLQDYRRLEERLDKVEQRKLEVLKENNKLKDKLSELERSFNKSQEKVRKLIKEKESLYKYIAKLLGQNKVLAGKIDELKSQINDYQENDRKAAVKIENLTQSEEDLKERLKHLSLEKSKLIHEIKQQNQTESEYHHRVNQLVKEKHYLLQERSNLNKEIKAFREKEFINGLFDGISQLQEKQKLLLENENKLESVKISLKKTKETNRKKDKEIQALKDNFRQAQAQIKIKQAEIGKIVAEKLSLKTKLNEHEAMKKLIKTLQKDISKEKNERINILDELNKAREKTERLKAINNKLTLESTYAKEENSRIDKQNKILSKEISNLSANLVDLNNFVETLENEKEELKQKIVNYQHSQNQLDKNFQRVYEEKVDAKKRIDNFHIVTGHLTKEKITMEKEMARLNGESKALRSQINEYQKRERALLSQLKSSKENISKLTDQMLKITCMQGASNEERNNLSQMLKDVIKEKEDLEKKLSGTINYGLDKIGADRRSTRPSRRNSVSINMPRPGLHEKPH